VRTHRVDVSALTDPPPGHGLAHIEVEVGKAWFGDPPVTFIFVCRCDEVLESNMPTALEIMLEQHAKDAEDDYEKETGIAWSKARLQPEPP